MAEYIEREEYCEKHCRCSNEYCDKESCPIWKAPAADVAPVGWISVKDKMPEPETEVLAVCMRNGYRFICPVIFEDGTMLTQNSMWNWYELENYGTYSEENDDYFVPEGWWENRQFTPDDIYNNPVDCTVTHWMPLPEPPDERARKAAEMQDADVSAFGVHFANVQRDFNDLIGALGRIRAAAPETGEKLTSAVRALVEKMGGTL